MEGFVDSPNFHEGIEQKFWREKKQLALNHEQDIRLTVKSLSGYG